MPSTLRPCTPNRVKRRQRRTALLVAFAGSNFLASPVVAQDGLGLTFTVDTEARVARNPGLETTPTSGSVSSLETRLGASYLRETKTSVFQFDLSGTLDFSEDANGTFVSPSAKISYGQTTASSSIDASAFLADSDVSQLEFVLGEDDGGVSIVSAVSGVGTQRRHGADIALAFGRDTRVTTRATLGYAETDYIDTTDPDLIDISSMSAGLSATMDVSEVTQLTIAGKFTKSEEVGAAAKRNRSLTATVNHERPNGDISLEFGTSRGDSATRRHLSFTRDFALPNGSISTRFGLTHLQGGETGVTGALNWAHSLPRGDLSFGVSRNVSGDQGEEVKSTQLSAGYSHRFTPRLSGSLNASYNDIWEEDVALTTTSSRISASVSYDLDENWGLDVGATHQVRNEDGSPSADDTSVFVKFGRTFSY